MEELLKNLKAIRSDVDFENCKTLIDDNIIKSFDIIQIVGMVQEEYDVKIPVTELKPQNFNSVEALYELIVRLEEE